MVENNKNYAQNWLNNIENSLDVTAKTISKFESSQRDVIMDHLITNKDTIRAIGTFVGYENLDYIVSSGWIPPASFNPTKRGWYVATKNAQKSVITDVYEDAGAKRLVISVTAPVNKSSKLIGVLSTDISLDTITNRAKSIEISGGRAYFLDKNGLILGYPDEKIVGKKLVETYPEIKSIIDQMYQQEKGVLKYKLDGKSKMLIFDTIN
ncbi:cache domain-containing protein, partial [Campylobacter sp. RM12327]|uniref:cache domain-containing protein n=2 Tax=Campylobacter sputorum TaxID=206 RepID=UPI001896693D